MSASRDRYENDGYLVQDHGIPSEVAVSLAAALEGGIDVMAAELAVSREAYLAAVCRWSTPNTRVVEMVAAITDALQPVVVKLLGVEARPSRASIFRKSDDASLGTHGHQDAGYWVRPSSSRYDATTWIALDRVDEASGALRVVPGSHRGAVQAAVDYLAPNFVDPAEAWGGEALSLRMGAGAAVTFDPRLWHASHANAQGCVRRALAIRWVADNVRTREFLGSEIGCLDHFGMYTSGRFLREAMCQLAGDREIADGVDGLQWAVDHDLAATLPNPDAARAALGRLLLFMRASERHQATDQRGMVWEPVRDLVVAPTVGLGRLER